MQLVCGEATTEWVTYSYGRVIDEAVVLTAKLIVDAEAASDSGTGSFTKRKGSRATSLILMRPRTTAGR